MRKPFYWKARKAWYLQQGKSQIKLGDDKEEAMRRYHQLMAGQITADSDVLAAEIIGQFLDWSKRSQKESTYKNYRYYLKSFGAYLGRIKVRDLKPYHVTRWIDQHGWKGNTANGATRAAVRPFSWATSMGVIQDNPLPRVKRPSATPRECYITSAQFDKVLAEVDEAFGDFVIFMRETGCRPQEARNMEARHFDRDGQTITFPREESKGGKRKRIIVLNDRALGIVQRLALKHPEGALLRNGRGRKWTSDAVNNRFQRLSDKLGFPVFAYAIRHTWVTDALLNGVEPMTVATLAGHTSLKMVWQVYQHLQLQKDHMRRAAAQAVRGA